MAASIRLSTALLQTIYNFGVRRIFGVPGRENAHILFNEVPGLEYVTARVEFNAGIMAEATGRITRRPQVCFSTMGPGATNTATAIASARLNHSPLIAITAQLERDDKFYNLTHQCIDQRGLFEPLAKWSYELDAPGDLPWVLERAFQIALAEPAGPVHLSIPVDLFACEIPLEDVPSPPEAELRITTAAKHAEPSTIVAAHELLAGSRSPLCLIGEGVVRVDAHDALLAFCRDWRIPFITAANAKGISSHEDPLNYGAASPYMEGILKYDALSEIFSTVDVLVCVGYQYVDDLLPKMWAHGGSKTILSIGSTPTTEIQAKFAPDVECVGTILESLTAISALGIERKDARPTLGLREVYRAISADPPSVDGALTPEQVITTVNAHLDDGYLCTDIGYYRHHAILLARPPAVGRFITDAGLSSFGSGLPAAMAAQFAHPGKRVILVCGDGGFHSGSCDLETLARYNLPVVVIVMNNSAFELISLYQQRHAAATNPGIVTLGNVDFALLARANGCRGEHVDTVAGLSQALASNDWKSPLLIEVPLSYGSEPRFQESF